MGSKHFFKKYIALAIVVITIVTIFTVITYTNSRRILEESVESRLNSNINSVKSHITYEEQIRLIEEYDIREQDKTKQEELFSDTKYQEVINKLREEKDKIEADYIYTIEYTKEKLYFILDTDEEEKTYVGEEYEVDEETREFFKKATENKGQVYIAEVEDEYGHYITGCMAITEEDGREIIIAVDIPIDYLYRHRNMFIISLIVMESVLMMAFIGAGYYLYKLLKRNKEMQDKIEHMAYYDSLTTLPNRASLIDKLKEMMEALDKNPSYSLGLFFIDVDNFKKVNDSEGHVTGDILLQEIAQFLKEHSNLRPLVMKEKEFVARLGGDEFVMIYPVRSMEDINRFAQLLLGDFIEIKKENEIMKRYDVSLSIGSSVYPKDAEDISGLLRTADQAMYEAKRNGKGNYAVYVKPDNEESRK